MTLKRMANLILELAGGKVASKITDIKKGDFLPWKISLNLKNLEKKLGIKISTKEVINILKKLSLSPQPQTKTGSVLCVIPTYRSDIRLEEDLIEEVARIYGYNRFPKTIPIGTVSTTPIPYFFDDSFKIKTKNILTAFGFDEVMTLSLTSRDLIQKCLLNPDNHIRISNPVSLDYEFLRTSLIPNLLSAVQINPNESKLLLFELGKVYFGKPGNTSESYKLAGITKGLNFREFKGFLDTFFLKLNVKNLKIEFETYLNLWHPSLSATYLINQKEIGEFGLVNPKVCYNFGIENEVYAFEFDIKLLEQFSQVPVFKPPSEFPPQIEDLTLTFPPKTKTGEVISEIFNLHLPVIKIELKEIYKEAYTFRVWYQDPKKTLDNSEVANIRSKILKSIKVKFGGLIKE